GCFSLCDGWNVSGFGDAASVLSDLVDPILRPWIHESASLGSILRAAGGTRYAFEGNLAIAYLSEECSMFAIFSSRLGCLGSLLVSVLATGLLFWLFSR
ncbi:MAG: hypothetical protein ABIV47_26380, partial [Roseiflexaceae bacterium]